MLNLLILFVGLAVGMLLGWLFLVVSIMWEFRPKEPPTKEEWRMM